MFGKITYIIQQFSFFGLLIVKIIENWLQFERVIKVLLYTLIISNKQTNK